MADGTCIVNYAYDAWGNFEATYNVTNSLLIRVASETPFRYRGYQYDAETGLYYLNSRYYDAKIGRFINADSVSYLGASGDANSFNLYAYCSNNPVVFSDPYGNVMGEGLALGFSAGAVVIGGLILLASFTIPQNPGSISIPRPQEVISTIVDAFAGVFEKDDEKVEAPSISDTQNGENKGKTYYHVTTKEAAQAIMGTGMLCGSPMEGGYVFVFGLKPSKYAVENCGAHGNVVIAFETTAAFERDFGIEDIRIRRFNPLRSVFRGPVMISNVRIVE